MFGRWWLCEEAGAIRQARRKVLEMGPIVVNFLYIQKVSSIKLREKLQLPASPTVVKIEKTESEKAYSQGQRVVLKDSQPKTYK